MVGGQHLWRCCWSTCRCDTSSTIGDVRECAPTAAGGDTSHLNMAHIENPGLDLLC
jgi:hypothetical protein